MLGEQDREFLPPAQLAAAAEHSNCLCVLGAAFRVAARAWRSCQEIHSNAKTRETWAILWARTVLTLFALSTPGLLDITGVHKANGTRGVCL